MDAKPNLIGRTVTNVRCMTAEELEAENWDAHWANPTAIVFDDGTVVYASRDDEGNGPGVLFGIDSTGGFRLTAD